jgi:hypothetical protein
MGNYVSKKSHHPIYTPKSTIYTPEPSKLISLKVIPNVTEIKWI